jgi:hypothetical protein
MQPPSILVLLDDEPLWLESYQRWLEPLLDARGIQLRKFTDDRDAAEFVCSNHRSIRGYVQDVCRSRYDVSQRHGLNFFGAIVQFLTPTARVLFSSASILPEEIRDIFRCKTVESYVLFKSELEPEVFRQRVDWMLTDRPHDLAVVSSTWMQDQEHLDSLTVPWRSVRRYLSASPSLLHKLPPRDFERLVAEMYRDHGWDVELTAASRDGGYDLVALRRVEPQEIRVLVEVKRYDPRRPVGVSLIRSLYATRTIQKASQVVLATSSYVSRYAKTEFRTAIPHELSFIERDELLEWCAKHSLSTFGFSR